MRANKYHSHKVIRDGVTFDSRKEFRRYEELLLLQQAGEIKNLRRQVKFVLIPTQRAPSKIGARGGVKKGKLLERECAYIADFVYIQNGKTVVEDTKGVRTKDYIIKRKLMLYTQGIRIREV